MSGVNHADADEFCNHWVDRGGLVNDPQYGGSVVWPGERRGHVYFRDCHKEGGLVNNKGDELEVRVSEISLKVFGQEQVGDDVWWPRVTPHQSVDGPRGIELHAPRYKSQSVVEPQMVGFATYTIGQVWGQAAVFSARAHQSAIYRWEYSNRQARSEPSPGLERVGCDIYMPLPLAPRGACSGASPPSVLAPFSQFIIESPEFPKGRGVSEACAPGGWPFLPPCQP